MKRLGESEAVSKKEKSPCWHLAASFWAHPEALHCDKRFRGLPGWCTEHQIANMLPSSRSNSFAALSEQQIGAQPEGNAKARKRKARKLSDRRSTSDAAQVAEPPKLSRLSMGPTGVDGGLEDGEACIQKLRDSHRGEHWSCQTPGAAQSCGMSGLCCQSLLVSERLMGRGNDLC